MDRMDDSADVTSVPTWGLTKVAGAMALWALTFPGIAAALDCEEPTPACGPNQTCARGYAKTSSAEVLGLDIGLLRTGYTDCQVAPPNFNVQTAGTPFVGLAPLANVIANESRTRARVQGQRFVQSTAGEATAEVLPSLLPTLIPPLLSVATTGAQATICGDGVDGSSGITILEINGQNVLPAEPIGNNVEIVPVAPLQLVRLNEQIVETVTVGDCTTRRITQNALHVQVLSGLELVDIVISGAYAESTTCGTPPTAEPTNFGAIYGGQPGDATLLPYFVVGPAGTTQAKDAHVTIIHDDENINPGGEYVHWRIFDVNSVEACDVCVELTREDVYVERIARLINDNCGAIPQAALDAGDGINGNGIFVGYATFEPSYSPSCTTVNPENDFISHFYHTELQTGLASGFNGPVYSPSLDPLARSFEEFGLIDGDPLYFRLLVGLGEPAGPDAGSLTNLVVWSDRSGACGGLTDSSCLVGPGPNGVLRVCDESENCTSQARPLLTREVNIVSADSLVPGVFTTDGGWLSLLSSPTNGDRLNVLGYSDNRANGLGATLNFEAIFPAQRTLTPLQCL